jgi:hypothetical protein
VHGQLVRDDGRPGHYSSSLYFSSGFSFLIFREFLLFIVVVVCSIVLTLQNSTTGGTEASAFKYNIIFIIRPHADKPVARALFAFSSQPNCCPVVLLPNASFVVKSLHVASIFGLSQPEVRESKESQMTEEYLKRAATKFEPIFIVLE